ncbi:MAG: histidinol dehydrogenase [Desulfobacterales bacterium SG8_35_2]|nr:MAG: histidinol dehydrogenase [Desulfobacterales bacterium SG8_35_2]
MIITPIKSKSNAGKNLIENLRARFQETDTDCRRVVAEILTAVRENGDDALLEYTRKFDAANFQMGQLQVTQEEFDRSYSQVDAAFMETLSLAIERLQFFHEQELEKSWTLTRDDGVITGRLVRPVSAAGLYVPGGQGGKTPLVSSVLMNGIPAGIAGVRKRIMVTPPNEKGEVHPALLVAAREIGIDQIFKVGSCWAIAALAYGTQSIPRVDVIVGPGNQYVAEAKQQVSGIVGIDMLAGPSEVLIVADGSSHPSYIAADMLAQAEHDPQALAMLVTTSPDIGEQVVLELERQLNELSRKEIAATALRNRGVILLVDNLDEAIDLANKIAAEHLELMIEKPDSWLHAIQHAGAIFLGNYSPEAAGDYLAGPNHVLPTMGTARFSSALGVETFLKKSSIISYNRAALLEDGPHIMALANLEGLSAHAKSVAARMKGDSRH